jgi:hypothetical protein
MYPLHFVMSHPIVRIHWSSQVTELGMNGTGHSICVQVAFLNDNLEYSKLPAVRFPTVYWLFQMVTLSLPALVIEFMRHLCIEPGGPVFPSRYFHMT